MYVKGERTPINYQCRLRIRNISFVIQVLCVYKQFVSGIILYVSVCSELFVSITNDGARKGFKLGIERIVLRTDYMFYCKARTPT